VKGGAEAGVKFIEAATFMSHLANIGDAKDPDHPPASTTHRRMSEEEQAKAGVTPDMIRISVGLETLDDILWDIDNALSAAAGPESERKSEGKCPANRKTDPIRHALPDAPPPDAREKRRQRRSRSRQTAWDAPCGGNAVDARARRRDRAHGGRTDFERHRQRRVRHHLGRQTLHG